MKDRSGRKARWAVAAALLLLAYVGSYLAWSRGFPAREGVLRDGRRTFGFFVGDPDWEYSAVTFYYPLVRLDAAWGGRIHVFDLKYL